MDINIFNYISNISFKNSIIEQGSKSNYFEFNFMSKTFYVFSKTFYVDTHNELISQSDSYYYQKNIPQKEEHLYILKIELNQYLSEENFKNLFKEYNIEWKDSQKVFDFFINFYEKFTTIKAAKLIEDSELLIKNRDFIVQDYNLCFPKK